jgi:hypothetical protein
MCPPVRAIRLTESSLQMDGSSGGGRSEAVKRVRDAPCLLSCPALYASGEYSKYSKLRTRSAPTTRVIFLSENTMIGWPRYGNASMGQSHCLHACLQRPPGFGVGGSLLGSPSAECLSHRDG